MAKVYFLCTGNACRSQMAEGFAQKYFPDDWEIRSAGIEKHGLNPKASKVMQEIGINISQQSSKLIELNYLNQCDLIVTLCGDARDRCPLTLQQVKKIHWPLNDPAQASGSPTQIMQTFRNVRDEIEKLVQDLARQVTNL